MTRHPYALYDAFSDAAFGGSQAAVVDRAQGIDRAQRIRIARELGYPATGFIDGVQGDTVYAQFFSTVMEQPMCGHGTVCLFSYLVDTGQICPEAPEAMLSLRLPKTQASVRLSTGTGGRPAVMLQIAPPVFSRPQVDVGELARHLGSDLDLFDPDLPLEVAKGDFTHLVVPARDLRAIGAIAPDFDGLTRFCRAHGIETVAVVTGQTVDQKADLHVRDFCPAVGVAESASAGTTNAALACYAVRHQLVATDKDRITVRAEQGIEIGRPSAIQSVVTLSKGEDTEVGEIWTGGVATKLVEGWIEIPET